MQYKYRWYSIFAAAMTVVVLGFLGFLQKDLAQFISLQKTKKNLQHKISQLHTTHTDLMLLHNEQKVSEKDFVSDMGVLAHQSGSEIQLIRLADTESTSDSGTLSFHLIAQADFQQLMTFIAGINQLPYTTLINDFTCEQKSNQLVLKADILMFTISSTIKNYQHKSLAQLQNPFCLTAKVMMENALTKLKTVSIKQIKMTGYLCQGKRHQALITLPNGLLAAVKPGDKIGKEQAVIAAISPDQIILLAPNKHKMIIKM